MKLHRSLIRIERFEGGYAHAIIPSWNPDIEVKIHTNKFDPVVLAFCRNGSYVLGGVSIGAKHIEDLEFGPINELVEDTTKQFYSHELPDDLIEELQKTLAELNSENTNI